MEQGDPATAQNSASPPSSRRAALEKERQDAEPRKRSRMRSGFTSLRDFATFALGLGIVIHEVFLSPTVNVASLSIGVALTGLPIALGADERRAKS